MQYTDAGPVLYVSDQSDMSVVDFIRFRSDRSLDVRRIEADDIDDKVERWYSDHARKSDASASKLPEQRPTGSESDSRVVKLINDLINDSIRQKASDIHIEPGEDYVQCRTRIDGVLLNRQQITLDDAPEVISRLKIMSGLDIAGKTTPPGRTYRFQVRAPDGRHSRIGYPDRRR